MFIIYAFNHFIIKILAIKFVVVVYFLYEPAKI